MNPSNTQKITGYHWRLFFICFFGTVFAGTISTLMSVYLPVAVKEIMGDQPGRDLDHISAYINSIFIFGGAIGGLSTGFLSDKAGRKTGVIVSIASYALFTILTGYMHHWSGIVICRFLSGFGLGAVLVTTPTLMMEVWPEKSRAIFIGILSIGIPVGIFSAGLIDIFVHSWRQAFNVGYIPLAIAIASIWFLKESDKWQEQETNLSQSTEPKESILSPYYRKDLVMGSIIFGAMLIGLWAIFSWIPTWIQTLITEGDGQQERGLSMMMLGAGGLSGGSISGWVIKKAGLRFSMILCFAVCLVMSFLLFKTNAVFSPLVYVEISILAIFFGISQGVLSVYIPSLFPVQIRGTATGFCFNIGRFVTATAVLFVGVLVKALGGYGNSLFIFSFVFLIGLVVTFSSKTGTSINSNGTY